MVATHAPYAAVLLCGAGSALPRSHSQCVWSVRVTAIASAVVLSGLGGSVLRRIGRR